MPKFRFSWDNFDNQTIESLAFELHYEKQSGLSAKEYLSQIIKRPNINFVRQTKRILERTWLKNQDFGGKYVTDIVRTLVENGNGPSNRQPKTFEECLKFIEDTKNTKNIQELLVKCLTKYGDSDKNTTQNPFEQFIPRFSIINPKKQASDTRKPHPYQNVVWNKLNAEYSKSISTGVLAGMVVMPTGSGKTFTAVRWLIQNVINKKGKVLWIAHRHELLEQAAMAFYTASYLATDRDEIRIRIVSGNHHPTHSIDTADDVIIAMSYLSRNDYISQKILSDKNIFLVIDEAHHAPAKSYKDLIDILKAKKNYKILGLTATPTRTSDFEKPILSKLFNDNEICNINTRELIDNGYLATPIPIRVKTNYQIEKDITKDDIKTLLHKHDLSEEWKDRIADWDERNEIILQTYINEKNKYGKTLIFALNVYHADLLKDKFMINQIEAEYVASYRLDNINDSNKEIINRFKDKNSGLNVLINVQILTEGVDIPNIQTVFLARPTASEILLRQMIGRALRGKNANGTEFAYIVSFEDHWELYGDHWESPLDLISDIIPIQYDSNELKPKQEIAKIGNNVIEHLPWDLIKITTNNLRRNIELAADIFEAVPHGWYLLESIGNEEKETEPYKNIIHVYDHQKNCWEHLINDLLSLDQKQILNFSSEILFDNYFTDCDVPQPSDFNIQMMLDFIQENYEKPEFIEYSERKNSDPYEIAEEIFKTKLTIDEVDNLIVEKYKNPLANKIYPSFREFTSAINDAIFEIKHPDQATRKFYGEPIFDDLPNYKLSPGNHNLEKILKSVLTKGKEILGFNPPDNGITIEWTKRLIKGYYGICYQGKQVGEGKIKINSLLNSSSITIGTLEFLVWHEYLHTYLPFEKHTKYFRELEKKWKTFHESNKELDSLNERFGIQYW